MAFCERRCSSPKCQKPLTGRRDKRYCGHACQSSHYRDVHREHIKQQSAEYHKANRAKINRQAAKHRKLHPEKVIPRQAKYEKLHPEVRAKCHENELTNHRRGVSTAEFEARIQEQGSRCPIGNHPFAGRGRAKHAPVLDHDHKNGLNRDVICREHNTALGMFHDSSAELRAAIAYLRVWRKKHMPIRSVL